MGLTPYYTPLADYLYFPSAINSLRTSFRGDSSYNRAGPLAGAGVMRARWVGVGGGLNWFGGYVVLRLARHACVRPAPGVYGRGRMMRAHDARARRHDAGAGRRPGGGDRVVGERVYVDITISVRGLFLEVVHGRPLPVAAWKHFKGVFLFVCFALLCRPCPVRRSR